MTLFLQKQKKRQTVKTTHIRLHHNEKHAPKIKTNKKRLTFHCFRKMFLSTSIDSGIGLTAGKKMVGKVIPQSDDTYLTTIQLRKKFIQLKKYLTIKQAVEPESQEEIQKLTKAVVKLQEDADSYKTISDAITKENKKLKTKVETLEKKISALNKKWAPLRDVLGDFKTIASRGGLFDGKGNRITEKEYEALRKRKQCMHS